MRVKKDTQRIFCFVRAVFWFAAAFSVLLWRQNTIDSSFYDKCICLLYEVYNPMIAQIPHF